MHTQRPPAIMTNTQSAKNTFHNVMYATIPHCMKRYKHKMNDLDYVYWMEFLTEIIRDEIDGYIKRQYTRIPSASPTDFAKFIDREFNAIVAPVCEKLIKREFNKEKRRAIIAHCNREFKSTEIDTQRCFKVHFNPEANQVCMFQRDE